MQRMNLRAIKTLAASAMVLAVATGWGGFGGEARALPVYLTSDGNEPWGESTNEAAMDAVFGSGNWQDSRFETVDTGALFSAEFIYMDGGDSAADEMESFLTANAAAISAYVSGGGRLFLNSAPNEGDGMSFGFGVDLVYTASQYCNSNCDAVDPAHAIFNGPFATTTSFTGSSFTHAVLEGDLDALMEDGSNNILLGQQAFGSGLVVFGAMTTTNFHGPQPEADNLRANIIAYTANAEVDVPVASLPEPGVLGLLGLGLVGLGFARRRKTA